MVFRGREPERTRSWMPSTPPGRRRPAKGTISYAASSVLAKQIEQDAPAQIFISADLDWMDYVEQKKPDQAGSAREPARQPHRARLLARTKRSLSRSSRAFGHGQAYRRWLSRPGQCQIAFRPAKYR